MTNDNDFKQLHKISNTKRSNKITTIGIIHPCYGYERVSYGLTLTKFQYKIIKALPIHRLIKCRTGFYNNTSFVLSFGTKLVHTWNKLPLSSKPFVVTYENELPRYLENPPWWQLKLGMAILRGSRCRRILALSEAAKKEFTKRCQLMGYHDVIDKITVFRGGVPLPISAKSDYPTTGPIKLLFIAMHAIRKGIIPLLAACEKLINQGIELQLTLIGGLASENCYVYQQFIPNTDQIMARIIDYDWIDYQGKLPIKETLAQIKQHDVLTFPTFDESLGWVTIEAGLLGVPTIATAIFAIPELIDHKETGYLIPIETRAEDQRFIGLDTTGDTLRQHLSNAEKALEAGLIETVSYLAKNRPLVKQWGMAAKAKLTKMYDPNIAQNQLSKIYNDALK